MPDSTHATRYPSPAELAEIAGTAKRLGQALRHHYPIREASPKENPYRLLFPESEPYWNAQRPVGDDTTGNQRRDIDEVGNAYFACNELVKDIEPAGAFDDYTGPRAEKLRKKYSDARTGRRVVTGWDIKVSRAIKSLKDCLNTVKDALHPSPEAEYFEPLSLKVVEHIEGAADLLAQYGRERETAQLPEWSNSHLESAGPVDVTTPQSTKVAETVPCLFRFEGAVYRVRFEDESGTIDAALAGAGYICRLLQQPRIPLKATDLVGAVAALGFVSFWRRRTAALVCIYVLIYVISLLIPNTD
jgi:hypothetical protein